MLHLQRSLYATQQAGAAIRPPTSLKAALQTAETATFPLQHDEPKQQEQAQNATVGYHEQPQGAGASILHRPQPIRTTPELIAKRAAQARQAQQLTMAIRNTKSAQELEQLYSQHRSSMNYIHMTAMLMRLARLTSNANNYKTTSIKPAVRMFLSALVPFIGMHLLTLRPRQLAGVMWALGSIGYTPQPAWIVEWTGCVARQLVNFTPKDIAMSAWGLAASNSISLGTASGAPGALVQLCNAAIQPQNLTNLQPQDVSNIIWALAAAGVRPNERILQTLTGHAATLITAQQLQHTSNSGAGLNSVNTPQNVVGTHLPLYNAASSTQNGTPRLQQAQQAGACVAPVQTVHCIANPWTAKLLGTPHASQITTQVYHRPFKALELVNLVWALARLRYWPGHALLEAATTGFLHMTTHTQLGAKPHSNDYDSHSNELQTHLKSHRQSSASNSPESDQPQLYAVLLWSIAMLKWRPSTEQMTMLLDGFLKHAASAHPPICKTGGSSFSRHSYPAQIAPGVDLAQVMWAVAAVGYKPNQHIKTQLSLAGYAALLATAVQTDAIDTNSWGRLTVHESFQHALPDARPQTTSSSRKDVYRLHAQMAASIKNSAVGVEGTALDIKGVSSVIWCLSHVHGSQAQPLSARPPPQQPQQPEQQQQLPKAILCAARSALIGISADMAQLSSTRLLRLLIACARLHIQLPRSFLQAVEQRTINEVHAYSPAQLLQLVRSLAILRSKLSFKCLQAIRKQLFKVLNCKKDPHRQDDMAMQFVQLHPSQIVQLLWAFSKLAKGRGRFSTAEADVISSSIAACTSKLRPAKLSRLLLVVQKLHIRPKISTIKAFATKIRALTAAKSDLLHCDEACAVDGSIECSIDTCRHLRLVVLRLQAWQRLLLLDQRKMCFRLSAKMPKIAWHSPF